MVRVVGVPAQHLMSEHADRKGAKTASKADADLRAFLSRLLRELPLSKIQIADALAEKLSEPVSLARLESFIAPTKRSARLPAYFLPALAEVLDCDAIFGLAR